MTPPRIVLLTTGGTIAGVSDSGTAEAYTAGVLDGTAIAAAIPDLASLVTLEVQPCLSIDSRDATPADWLSMARAARAVLAREEVAGLVISHGTDTLEESALFLDAVLPAGKPVVMTGAMRPATAISADGPANLRDALRVAALPASAGHGVLVVFNEQILAASGLRKAHATHINAFANQDGPLGTTRPGAPRYFAPPPPHAEALPLPETLPQVCILHAGAGSSPELATAAVGLGASGLVLALSGNGSVPAAWEKTLQALSAQGIALVRGTRCAQGFIAARDDDERCGSWPAGRLSAAQARVALMLALTQGAAARQVFSRMAGTAQSS